MINNLKNDGNSEEGLASYVAMIGNQNKLKRLDMVELAYENANFGMYPKQGEEFAKERNIRQAIFDRFPTTVDFEKWNAPLVGVDVIAYLLLGSHLMRANIKYIGLACRVFREEMARLGIKSIDLLRY